MIDEPPETTSASSAPHRHQSSGGGGHKGGKQSVAYKSKDEGSSKEARKRGRNSGGAGSKTTESELTAQIEQLQDKISQLTQFVSNLSETPRVSGGGGGSVRRDSVGGPRGPALPLTAEEKVKLEEDMNQLTPDDLCQVVDKKLRNCPGVVLDPFTGMLQELDVDMMAPRDQRNLKRYVARLLNLRNQKVKENEERAREIVAQQRALEQLQEMQRRRRRANSSIVVGATSLAVITLTNCTIIAHFYLHEAVQYIPWLRDGEDLVDPQGWLTYGLHFGFKNYLIMKSSQAKEHQSAKMGAAMIAAAFTNPLVESLASDMLPYPIDIAFYCGTRIHFVIIPFGVIPFIICILNLPYALSYASKEALVGNPDDI
ncbi:hypothetical protein Pmar_PMAR006429 [Perkinsus marinus ATCC 50983]|uniref:NET domain-containing protein n=1 Tax=Perkinsus marinus (strain ATCC 50983 / TXsc) TaxID=423536 RepID=C5K9N5_PERM5|nr:hypothetical protein Pmar_PMAR006429 [Perkinsus marinus ATCC 50983]EER18807.1 hypothetical protein Pmar_PMAR006429 [Perkinsus marinus ATCC 50983]|eukprot:XP_002787011.1 hypothetical protein Pmar_PMAR006429 [Perkinsus marinus ATCC 50983]